MNDHYETLGVEPTASQDEIKRAYRKRARETHPDHGGDTAKAAQVNGAYLVLSDPAKREKYDRTGQDEAPSDTLGQAIAVAMGAFDKAIAQAGERFQLANLIEEAKRYLDHDRQQGETATASLRHAVKRTGKILRRLKFKGTGQNFMARQLEEAIRRQEADIAGNEHRLAIIARARLMLDDYDYLMDAPAPPPPGAAAYAHWPYAATGNPHMMGWDLGRPSY